MADGAQRQTNVERFIKAVVDAAIFDEQEGVSERNLERNSRKALMKRLNLSQYRIKSRYGDGPSARSVYTAARFLYRTETSE